MENLDHFVFFVRILEIIDPDLKFLRNAEYYYLHNALRIVEIMDPTDLIRVCSSSLTPTAGRIICNASESRSI